MAVKQIAITTAINENFEFPRETGELEAIRMDLSKVSYINSEGIRRLNSWMREMKKSMPALRIELEKVPPVVARPLSLIRVQTANNVIVKSVYVPYYCTNCNFDDETLVIREQMTSTTDLEANLPKMKCSKCGTAMEVDVEPKAYCAILK